MSTIQLISIAGSGLVMLLVFQLIRKRKLREEYSILWFIASAALIVFSAWRGSVDTVARWLGVAYPPSVLLLGVIVVGFLVALHFSISLTRLADQNKRLAQRLALLQHQVENKSGNGSRSQGASGA